MANRGEEIGNTNSGEQEDTTAHRLLVVDSGDSDSDIRDSDNIERDAHKHAARGAILVCPAASDIRGSERCNRDNIHEL